MENKEKRVPIYVVSLVLSFVIGYYEFFCKNIAKLARAVVYILKKHDGEKELNTREGKTLVSALWIVHHKARKLENVDSISTSVFDNRFCKMWRKIEGCICQYCYAHNQQAYQTGLREHNILNGLILRNILIPVNAFKILQFVSKFVRIESFGDVSNEIQARNYLRIQKAFPRKHFVIFSKNLEIWREAYIQEGYISAGKIPENLSFVASSPKLNEPMKINYDRFYFVNHVFTVYEKNYAKKHNIIINCGGLKCLNCIKQKINCFYKNSNQFYINELKKHSA